ncbi:MAG: DinB family protein, partial [Desulforhopalus sp.]
MDLMRTRTTLLHDGSKEQKRQEILEYFQKTFDLDGMLYNHLARQEAFYMRAEPLRHPLIFYLGHTATFYINKLNVARITDKRFNPGFESMFAIGVDEMSWDDLDEKNYDWPKVDEVRDYRSQVRSFVAELIHEMDLTLPITWENPFWAIMMGIEHQRIHLETSSVIIRRLPIGEVRSLEGWEVCP